MLLGNRNDLVMTVIEAAQKKDDQWLSSGIRFDQIDVLRGLAALIVVLHHCCGHVGGGSWWRVSALGYVMYPSHIFYHGYIGVDLFLVLSGFCLSWPVLVRPDKPFNLGTYAKRRFLRIYPPYFITFSLLLLGGWICRVSGLAQFQRMGFAQPLTPIQCLASLTLQMTHLLPVFWTLCLEARWYLLFPIVVLLARKYSLWPCLLIALIISSVTPYNEHGPSKLLVYLPAFISGVLAAQIRASTIQKPEPNIRARRLWLYGFGLTAFFLFCLIWLPKPDVFGRGTIREVLPTTGLFFFLLLCALENKSALPLPLRLLQKIGVFSYSLYLIHLPIIEVGYAVYRPTNLSPAAQLFYWLCIFVPFIVFLSYLFFLCVEKPFIGNSALGKKISSWVKQFRLSSATVFRGKAMQTKEIV